MRWRPPNLSFLDRRIVIPLTFLFTSSQLSRYARIYSQACPAAPPPTPNRSVCHSQRIIPLSCPVSQTLCQFRIIPQQFDPSKPSHSLHQSKQRQSSRQDLSIEFLFTLFHRQSHQVWQESETSSEQGREEPSVALVRSIRGRVLVREGLTQSCGDGRM